MISLGVYPGVSLSMARDRRDASRRLLADGQDPSVVLQAAEAAREAATKNTFELIARSYLGPPRNRAPHEAAVRQGVQACDRTGSARA